MLTSGILVLGFGIVAGCIITGIALLLGKNVGWLTDDCHHKWSKWSAAVIDNVLVDKQYRTCRKCNKTESRYVH